MINPSPDYTGHNLLCKIIGTFEKSAFILEASAHTQLLH